MQVSRKQIFGIFLFAASALALNRPVQAQDAATQKQAAWTLHLLESARYGEAADAAQSMVNAAPETPLPYQLRGTLALYVGVLSRARADFGEAAALDPDDPTTQYGLALCDMFGQDIASAQNHLVHARNAEALLDGEAADIATALAYVRFLGDDFSGAQSLVNSDSSPQGSLRQEVRAMLAFHADPQAGSKQLAQFLATANGSPRVTEDEGLRPLFEYQPAAVEPAVNQPDLQQMYAYRIASDLPVNPHKPAPPLTGTTDLAGPNTLPARASLVSFTIDGQVAAIVNQPPYDYHWDTSRVPNGTHTVCMEIVNASGDVLNTRTMTVSVRNKGSHVQNSGTDSAADALKTRLWNALRLRPCLKAAEWTLAQQAYKVGDQVSGNSDRAIAAALDPDYKSGREFAHTLFGPNAAGLLEGYWQGNESRREIALTFDDGPNPAKTPALLDALDLAHAPATFFVVGSRAEAAPDILRRMAASGDEVENHSYTHPNMNLIVPATAESELLRANVVIRALTGREPRFFRPPGGNANASVVSLMHSYGLSAAYWTVDALHAEDVGSSRGLVDYVVNHVHSGSIVLLHNGTDVTTTSIPALVAALRNRGYTLVTMSELVSGVRVAKGSAMPKMRE